MKKLNNNFAIALDQAGNEIIVYGKGIGFGKMPYELKDLSKIDKTYYDVDERSYGLISEIPEDILLQVTKLVEYVGQNIEDELSENLIFSLADHLNFAIKRYQGNIQVALPYSYELEYNYPEIHQIAKKFLKQINRVFNVQLPKEEITSICIHIIDGIRIKNGKKEKGLDYDKCISEITKIVEHNIGIKIKKSSYDYYRFKNHLKYFIERMYHKESLNEKQYTDMYHVLQESLPKIFECVKQINAYIENQFGYTCEEQELVYLMIYVNRLYMNEAEETDSL